MGNFQNNTAMGSAVSQEPRVAVVRTSPETVFESVQRAMEDARWTEFISAGADVSLKPNLGWDKLIPGSISARWVVEGVIRTIRDRVGKVYLVESDQVVVQVDDALELTRLNQVCHQYDIEWVNLSQSKFVRMQDDKRLVLKDVHIPEILTRTEVITLPLMKTHNKATISGAIKNQWGFLQTFRHNFHLVLSQALVDMNKLVKPRFAVMDGTIALEGNGPKSGHPREMNLVLASGDMVALDTTAARIMGFDPVEISHLQLCAEYGLGIADPDRITVLGETVEDIQVSFLPAKHNPVSRLELALRKPFVSRLVFHTPLLRLFCWGARRYYDWWDLTEGKAIRERILVESGYGKQWENRIVDRSL